MHIQVPPSGIVTTSGPVRDNFYSPSGTAHKKFCSAVGCSIYATSAFSGSSIASVPLTFSEVGGAPARGDLNLLPSTFAGLGASIRSDGAGWGINAILQVAQCSSNPATLNDCDLTRSEQLRSSVNGAFSLPFAVTAVAVASSQTIDCASAVGACSITVFDVRDFAGTKRSSPLTVIPTWIGTVSLSQSVIDPAKLNSATLQRWQPFASVDLQVCKATSCMSVSSAAVDGNGDFTTDPAALFLISRYPAGATCVGATDCFLRAVMVSDGTGNSFTDIALPFIPLSIDVTPNTNLVEGQTVTVNVGGLAQQSTIYVYECIPGYECAPLPFASGVADASGNDSLSVNVTNNWLDSVNNPVDCAVDACSLYAQESNATVPVAAPLTFASAQPVVSNYTPTESNAVHAAAAKLKLSDIQYQHVSSWAVAYIFGIANVTATTPVSNVGTNSVATTYPSTEYNFLSGVATNVGLTFAQYQKLSALAVAYLLG